MPELTVITKSGPRAEPVAPISRRRPDRQVRVLEIQATNARAKRQGLTFWCLKLRTT
jgi:hypothetical protein